MCVDPKLDSVWKKCAWKPGLPINEKELDQGNWASIFIEAFGGTKEEIKEVLQQYPKPKPKPQQAKAKRTSQIVDLSETDAKEEVDGLADLRGDEDVVQRVMRLSQTPTRCYGFGSSSNSNSNSNSNNNSNNNSNSPYHQRNYMSNDTFHRSPSVEETNASNSNKRKQNTQSTGRRDKTQSKRGKLKLSHAERWRRIKAFEAKQKAEKQQKKNRQQSLKRNKKQDTDSQPPAWCPHQLHCHWPQLKTANRSAIKRILKVCGKKKNLCPTNL